MLICTRAESIRKYAVLEQAAVQHFLESVRKTAGNSSPEVMHSEAAEVQSRHGQPRLAVCHAKHTLKISKDIQFSDVDLDSNRASC